MTSDSHSPSSDFSFLKPLALNAIWVWISAAMSTSKLHDHALSLRSLTKALSCLFFCCVLQWKTHSTAHIFFVNNIDQQVWMDVTFFNLFLILVCCLWPCVYMQGRCSRWHKWPLSWHTLGIYGWGKTKSCLPRNIQEKLIQINWKACIKLHSILCEDSHSELK